MHSFEREKVSIYEERGQKYLNLAGKLRKINIYYDHFEIFNMFWVYV